MTQTNRQNCLIFSLILFFLHFFQPLAAQNEVINKLVDQKKKEYGDIVVIAWRGDSVFYKKEAGEFTVNSQETVSAASSWFTAALAIRADGRLRRFDDRRGRGDRYRFGNCRLHRQIERH